MKVFILAILLAVAAAAPSSTYEKYEPPKITIVSQSDVRNLDGSSVWSYAGSDGTTREESQVQKELKAVTKDSYGKETYETVMGNTNKGSSYWISPEGERFTLTWVADDAGFVPKGDHLPVAPVYDGVPPVAPVYDGVAPEPVKLPYERTGLGY